MNSYLHNLAEQASSRTPVLRPRLPSWFEPLSPVEPRLALEPVAAETEVGEPEPPASRPRRTEPSTPRRAALPPPVSVRTETEVPPDERAPAVPPVRRRHVPPPPSAAEPPIEGVRTADRTATLLPGPRPPEARRPVAQAPAPEVGPTTIEARAPAAQANVSPPPPRVPRGAVQPVPREEKLGDVRVTEKETSITPIERIVERTVLRPTPSAIPSIPPPVRRVVEPALALVPKRDRPALTAETPPAPAIQVTIGRIEIRAIPTPASPPARTAGAARPAGMSLEEYLRKRDGRETR